MYPIEKRYLVLRNDDRDVYTEQLEGARDIKLDRKVARCRLDAIAKMLPMATWSMVIIDDREEYSLRRMVILDVLSGETKTEEQKIVRNKSGYKRFGATI